MTIMQITAETREKAKAEAIERLHLPEEALDLEWAEEEEELLAGAKPFDVTEHSRRLEPFRSNDRAGDYLDFRFHDWGGLWLE